MLMTSMAKQLMKYCVVYIKVSLQTIKFLFRSKIELNNYKLGAIHSLGEYHIGWKHCNQILLKLTEHSAGLRDPTFP